MRLEINTRQSAAGTYLAAALCLGLVFSGSLVGCTHEPASPAPLGPAAPAASPAATAVGGGGGLTEITLKPMDAQVKVAVVGFPLQLVVMAYSKTGAVNQTSAATYTVSDPKIAQVDTQGRVLATSSGKVTIVADLDDLRSKPLVLTLLHAPPPPPQ